MQLDGRITRNLPLSIAYQFPPHFVRIRRTRVATTPQAKCPGPIEGAIVPLAIDPLHRGVTV